MSDDPFEIPERGGPQQKIVAGAWSGTGRGAAAFTVRPDPSLQPGYDWFYDLFTETPRDIPLSIYHSISRFGDEIAAHHSMFTVLVDYEPVEFEYTRWNADRTEVLDSGISTGVDVPEGEVRPVEIIDLVLAAELFPDVRAYEISVGVSSVSSEKKGYDSHQRLVLYSGGYEVPPRPCAPRPAESAWLEIEDVLQRDVGAKAIMLFIDGLETGHQLRGEVPTYVEGGTTVSLYGSLYRNSERPKVTAIRPTVNGRPFGHTIWHMQGGPDTYPGRWVDGRFSFTYDVPEEPGTYEVVAMTWHDPFETFRDLEGNRIDGVDAGINVFQHSNSIRFVVPDP